MTQQHSVLKYIQKSIRALFILVVLFSLASYQNIVYAQQDNLDKGDEAFTNWLNELRHEALDNGISEATIDLAFSEVTPPVKRIIEKDRNQAEVVQTYSKYLNDRVSEWKINKGRELLEEHDELFNVIAQDFGVQPRFIASIWGMETNYGTHPITEPVFNILATLAYDTRRAVLFRAQFLAALTMLDSGFPAYEQMTSSFQGAMGQAQFLPENYLRLAIDYDGDGKRDIWDTEADVFASIANHLKSGGWQYDQTWGLAVLLPQGGESTLLASRSEGLRPDQYCKRYTSLGVWRDLQEWQELGVRCEDGTDLPTRSIPAALIVADPGDDKGYIVYRNFCTIMRYNPAFKYALSIGLLSDTFESE